MSWAIAASAGLGIASSIMKSKAEAEAMLADAKVQRERLRYLRERQTNAYEKNKASNDRVELENSFKVEQSLLQAQSDLAADFAGTGVSGTSVDEFSTEILAQASEDRASVSRQAGENKAALDYQRTAELKDQQFELDQMPQFDGDSAITQALLTGVSQGLTLRR